MASIIKNGISLHQLQLAMFDFLNKNKECKFIGIDNTNSDLPTLSVAVDEFISKTDVVFLKLPYVYTARTGTLRLIDKDENILAQLKTTLTNDFFLLITACDTEYELSYIFYRHLLTYADT